MNDVTPVARPPDLAATATDATVVPHNPRRALSVWDAAMITVGIVIGAGIFKTPATVAGMAGSVGWTIAVWILGGVLSLIGALTYAELASTFPSAGGDYSFLSRAYGKNVSFFFAWARVTVIVTGSIALLSYVLGDYLTHLWPLGEHSSTIYAAIAIVSLTAVNLIGLKTSSRVQNLLTLLELGGVLLIAAIGFMVAPAAQPSSLTTVQSAPETLGLALVFVLLTYGGWNEAAYVSAEVKGGGRAILRALVLAIALLTFAYTVFVIAALRSLGLEGLRTSTALGADIAQVGLGSVGAQLLGLLVAVAALTSINATMIVGARSNYALGADWPALSFLRRWHDERSTPVAGFLIQAAIALALVAFAATEKDGFNAMVEFTAPVFWFFFMLSGLALIVLRFKEPDVVRPFKVPLYPLLPLIFSATCAYLFYSSITYAQSQNATHVAFYVMLGGALVWVLLKWKSNAS